MLKQANAVAESFGYFFNEKGEVVYKVPRIGIELQDLEKSRSSWQSRAENQKPKQFELI